MYHLHVLPTVQQKSHCQMLLSVFPLVSLCLTSLVLAELLSPEAVDAYCCKRCSTGASGLPLHGPGSPIPVFLQTPPAQRVSKQTRGAQKPSSTLLTAFVGI